MAENQNTTDQRKKSLSKITQFRSKITSKFANTRSNIASKFKKIRTNAGPNQKIKPKEEIVITVNSNGSKKTTFTLILATGFVCCIFMLDFFQVISFPGGFSVRNLLVKNETSITVSVKMPESVDKIFTGFTVMQIIDIDYKNGEQKNPTGYCYHSYEIGFGYEKITGADLFSKINLACKNQDRNLPEPQIISVNPVSSEAFGSFTRARCEEWDYNTELREREIRANLEKDKQSKTIIDKGQKILGSYLRLYCKAIAAL